MTKPIPDGYGTVTPHIVCKGASAAIDFYRKAFGAEERFRMPGPDGLIMHAEVQIGDSIVMVSDPMEGGGESPTKLGGNHGSLMIYTEDVDAAWKRAVDAGAQGEMPPADMFWGDRYGQVRDPFGHRWALATHVEDVSPEEMTKRMAAMSG